MGTITNKAYQLWQQTGCSENRKDRQEKIVLHVFEEIKKNNPRDIRCKAIFQHVYKAWLMRKVKKALSAFKFDLFTSGRAADHLNLFSKKELWFIDHKTSKIFKNLIAKDYNLNLSQKGHRWSGKVNKYYKKPEFLIGSALLYRLKTTSKGFKKAALCMEALPQNKIFKAIVKGIDDEEVMNGLTRYLETPFEKGKKTKDILYGILFCAGWENVKWIAKHESKKTVKKISLLGQTLLSKANKMIFQPLMTRAGLRRATLCA